MALTFRFAQETDTLPDPAIIRSWPTTSTCWTRWWPMRPPSGTSCLKSAEPRSSLPWRTGQRWASPCFFKTSPPSWAGRACIWRTCMSGRSTGERDMARLSSGGWRPSPRSGTAAAWSGGPGLEHPQHRLLQVPGGGDHGGLDRLPPYRTGIAEAGRTGISGCGNR